MSLPDSSAWAQVALWDSQGTPFADDSIPTVLPTPLEDSFDQRMFFLRMPGSSSYFLLGEMGAAPQQPAAVTAARADLQASLDQGSVSLLVDSAQYGFGGIASGKIDAPTWVMGVGQSPFVLFVDPLSGVTADGTAALSFLTAPGGEVMGVEPSPFRIMLGTDSETLGELDFSGVTGYFPGPLGSLRLEGLVLTRPDGSVVDIDGFDVYDLMDGILLTEMRTDLRFDDAEQTVSCLVSSTLFGTSGLASGLLSTPGSEVMGVEPSPFRWVVDPDTGMPPDGERAISFFVDPGSEVMGVEPSPFRIQLVSELEILGTLDFSQVSGYVGSLYLEDVRLELEDGSSLAVESLDTVDSDVSIDIKPGSEENTINLGSAGVIPVAILSSPVFDATEVDPDTVSLAGASVKVVGKGDKLLAHIEDVDGDGLDDLVCKILTEELLIECGASEAVLEAETYEGDVIRGVDIVTIVP